MSGKAPNNSMLEAGTRHWLRRTLGLSLLSGPVTNSEFQVPVADVGRYP